MTAAEVLVDHALGLRWADVTDHARGTARAFLLDSLCVGIAGARAPHADAILAAAQRWGEGAAASVLGRPGVRLPAAGAAFVNGFQIHAQEFDCVHEPAVLHPMATLLAAVMAEVEGAARPISGAEVLAALVAGVDVSVTLGVAASSPLKFFRPATSGLFGATAAVARLRGLDREAALDAFGYALAFASGTMQAHAEGKPALPVQIANAARSAIAAGDVAAAGLPGPRGSVDGPFGYMTLFESAWDLAPALAELGRRFRVAEVSWKPFPTGRAAHGAIVATEALVREQGLTAETLERLTYRAPPLIDRLVGRPARDDMQPAYARLCFPYLGAAVLRRGAVGLDDFTPERLADPETLALAARIVVEDDGSPDPAAFTPATATARLVDGRELRHEVRAQYGSPAWPLSRAEQLAKARACLAVAGCERLLEPLVAAVDAFEHATDAAAVFRLAAGSPA